MSTASDGQINAAAPSGALPEINKVQPDAAWAWLALGFADLKAMPGVSLTYGLVFALISALIAGGLFMLKLGAFLPALAAGFMLVAPLGAVGMYEASRRRETGEAIGLGLVIRASLARPGQLAYMGALLMVLLLAWMELAALLFALFFGGMTIPAMNEFIETLLMTSHGLGLLVVGTATGAVLAFITFAFTAISVPMLLARDVDAVTAGLTSLKAVRKNFWAMVIWAWAISVLTAIGIVTLFVGMIVTFPLVGHATWHAYRALVAGK